MAAINIPWNQIQGIIGDVTRGVGESQTVTITRPSAADAISTQPWEGPAEGAGKDTFSNIPAVVAVENQVERDETGTNVAMQSIRAVIAGGDLSVTPQIGWEITDDKTGVIYSVKKVSKIQPGIDVLVYTVEGMA